MRISFSSITVIKRVLSLLLICLLIFSAFKILKSGAHRFNPQYLVDNTILQNKEFTPNVVEVISPRYKIKAYLLEEHSNPIINVGFMFKHAGRAYDPHNRQGLNNILSDVLTKGAGQYTRQQFNRLLEQKAISLNFNNSMDSFQGSIKFIKKDMDLATKLFNLSLTKPRLSQEDIARSKGDLITTIQSIPERPRDTLNVRALQLLYDTHPYGRNPYGNVKQIKQITSSELRNFMRKHFAYDNLIVGISGDITPKDAENLLDKMFAGLSKTNSSKKLATLDVQFPAPVYSILQDSPQYIGFLYAKAVAPSHPDFYPLLLANEILVGGGLNSRVQKKAREQEGLTYGAYAGLVDYDEFSYIHGSFSSTPNNFDNLLQIVYDEWINLGQTGVTQPELDRVKNYLIISEPLRYAELENITASLIYMQYKNLGLDFLQKRNSYIRNINLESINNVAKKYFTATNLRFITLGGNNTKEPMPNEYHSK